MGKKDKLQQLSCLLEKLYKIDKELGGTAKNQQNAKGTEGEFENAYNNCKERMFKINSTQKAQDARFERFGRDKVFITQESEMRSELNDCNRIISDMDKILTKQAKNKNQDKAELNRRDKQFNAIKQELYRMMKNKGLSPPEDYTEDLESSGDNNKETQGINQLKNKVFDSSRQGGNKNQRYEANDKELAAMSQFKVKDKEQDVIVDRIYDKVGQLHNKAQDMGGKLDHIGVQIVDVTKKVDDTNNILDTQNQKLKNLILKYRQPSKFCLDITLVMFLVGLIGVGYKMLS